VHTCACARMSSGSRSTRHRFVVGKALRIDQGQPRQAHGLHRARGGADIARVTGVRQGRHGCAVERRTGRMRPCRPVHIRIGTPPHQSGGISRPSGSSKPCIQLSTSSSRRRGAPARSSTAPLDLEHLQITTKRQSDFVTEVDKAAEAAIIDVLREAYPEYGILAEESGQTAGQRRRQRLSVDHRPARRHHQLHPRLSAVRGLDRPGLPRAGHPSGGL
jgi:hypothetical protein